MGAGDASQFKRRSVRLGGLALNYFQGGLGAPLVYLHGMSGWGRWESYHIAFGITHMVYAPQLPGWQDGAVPAEVTAVADYAATVVRLMDELGLGKIDLVGHSFGGWVALELAAAYPDRVSRLVVVDSMGLDLPEAPGADLGAMSEDEFLGAAFAQSGTVVIRGDFGGTVEEVRQSDEFRKQWASRGIIAKIPGARRGDPDLAGKLKDISADSLVVWGNQDRIVPIAHGRRIAQIIPRCKFAEIDGASHTPMRERRETFQRIVHDFFTAEGAAGVAAQRTW
jgi:pimeloyl-ACP methyl ester carboxylesterase